MNSGPPAFGPRASCWRLSRQHLSCLALAATIAAFPVLSATAALADASVAQTTPPPVASSSVAAASLKVLNEADAQRYAQAFSAAARGDFAVASNDAAIVADPSLRGRLAAVRLLNPDYRASYAELSGWLTVNADLPEGPRVYDLAMKRRPPGAPTPRAPASADAQTSAISLGERISRSLQVRPAAASRAQQAARAAFYEGDAQRAYDLGLASGDRWVTGLAAVRLKRFPEAVKALEPLANDAGESPWVRSGAAYWAARAASGAGDAAKAKSLLKLAARSPDTFYGLIAARELDKANAKAPAADAIADVLAAADLDTVADAAFVKSDPRAHRAAALMQIGLPIQAGEELKTAMATASDADRPRLTALALALNAPLGGADPAKAGWARFDLGTFPTPALQPLGGFVVDKALVYALVRQESRFNPNASSGAGAYGLMQLTAETAARLAGDPRLRRDPSALRDPGLNLKLGQAYVVKLLAGAKGDVVRAVAAYNSGPGAVEKLAARMGQDVDSLMLVESMPSGQTRDYVQRVLSYYWTYSQIFGHDAPGALANAR